MNVFLTGATGFIGSHLAEDLLDKGFNVRALLRTSSSLRWIADLKLDCYYANIFDSQSLLPGLKDVDIVIHSAGLTKALKNEDYYRVNFEGTKNLIDTIIENKLPLKRFVLISSQAAAGPASSMQPVTENDEPHPVSEYGKSKLMAEQYVLRQSDKLPVTIIRPPAVYGPRDTDVFQFFKTVKKGIIPKWQNRDKYLSFVYVKDLVKGIIIAAQHPKAEGQIYFIAEPRPHSWEELAREALKFFDKKALQVPVPLGLIKGIAFLSEQWSRVTHKPSIINQQKVAELLPDFWICSPKKIKEQLKFEAKTALSEGVKQTLQWYLDNQWL
ncbi:MAG: NAD-dependent epimerase/dehydratase family protein [Calditrichaeota bacterium]|nr:NAD-dependent epimerase/dehydratase family protein [Calditrichota bacterium]